MTRKKTANIKRHKVIRRLKGRCTGTAIVDRKQMDIYIIDLALSKLFNDGDKQTASLEEDVFQANKIDFTDNGSDRMWDILMSTGLVKPVIGFGRSGRMALTNDGYQLMSKFGSYQNFINLREQQAKANTPPSAAVPQFVFVKQKDDEEKEEKQDEKMKKSASGDHPIIID